MWSKDDSFSMVFWVTKFKYVIKFSFVWCCDVMTSCHDVTKPDLPISACRCARKLILFLFPWFFRSLSSKMPLTSHFCDSMTSWRHVMTSLIKLDSPISACRGARKFILFLLTWFCESLSSKKLMIFHSHDFVTSWRHVMTSQKLFNLSQVMNSLERWSCSGFHSFSGCSFSKC